MIGVSYISDLMQVHGTINRVVQTDCGPNLNMVHDDVPLILNQGEIILKRYRDTVLLGQLLKARKWHGPCPAPLSVFGGAGGGGVEVLVP